MSIVVGQQQIAGWETVTVTRSAESYPNNFAMTMTEANPDQPSQILVTPGQKCQVFVGSDLVVTGYVDRYTASIGPTSHEVELVGRGLGEDLVDCSVDTFSGVVKGASIGGSSALDLAQKLAAAYGISARCAVSALGPPITPVMVANGETPYEIIERVARYAGYLVYEDEYGALVLDRVGTKQMASGFAQGQNVEAASASLSVDQRFSSYIAVWNTIDTFSEGAAVSSTNKIAQADDTAFAKALGRTRLRIVVSPQPGNLINFGQNLVNWDLARRRGRSQAVQLTCDSWRASDGMLWQPNRLALVDLPKLRLVKQQWIIGSVTFRKDMSGTHADLTLMPPEAFSVEPSTLRLWDNELLAAAPATP